MSTTVGDKRALAGFDFASLIAPVPPDQFFAQHWENQPLFLQRDDQNFYKHLISQNDIEHIISFMDVRHPAIRLAKNGSYLPPPLYTTSLHYGDDVFIGIPDIGRVSAEYRSGASVVLPALHRTWEPLRLLCADLENCFDHVVHTNAYITPGNASGFSAHYDTHEVFMLQIAGKKHWRVYEPPLLLRMRVSHLRLRDTRLLNHCMTLSLPRAIYCTCRGDMSMLRRRRMFIQYILPSG